MDLGDELTFRSNVYDKPPEFNSSGVITNGASLVNATTATLTITLPDGTTATPTVANPPTATGQYAYDYMTSGGGPTGLYRGKWLFTMATGKTSSYEESFDVGSSLVTVDEALMHLRANGAVSNGFIVNPDDLDYLQWLCMVATDAVERDLGRVLVRRTVTDVFNGGKPNVILRSSPVISVTSVTESGTVLASDDYTVDVSSGVLYRGSMWAQTTAQRGFIFLWGRQNVTVVYVAGATNPPLIARKVALNTIQGMWQSRQLMPTPGIPEVVPGSMYIGTAALTAPELGAYNALRKAGIA